MGGTGPLGRGGAGPLRDKPAGFFTEASAAADGIEPVEAEAVAAGACIIDDLPRS